MIRCRRCGRNNLAIDIWCTSCKSFLDWEGEEIPRRAEPTSRLNSPDWRALRTRLAGWWERSRPGGAAPLVVSLQGRRISLRLLSGLAAVAIVVAVAASVAALTPAARALVPSLWRPQPSAPSQAQPSPLSGALQAGVAAAERKTGLRYTQESHCAASAACLFGGKATEGREAAAVEVSAGGAERPQSCVSYLVHDRAGWHALDTVCGAPGRVRPTIGPGNAVRAVDGCVNVREPAGLNGRVLACLASGTSVALDGGPDYVEGRLWWHLQGRGWMAHEFLRAE